MTNGRNTGRTAKRAKVIRERKRNQSAMRRQNSGSGGSGGSMGSGGSGGSGATRRSGGTRSAGSSDSLFGKRFDALLAEQRGNGHAFRGSLNEIGRRATNSMHGLMIEGLVKELNPKLSAPQRSFALEIIHGDLGGVLERTGKGIPDSYFKVGFDKRGRKLVAFAAHIALKLGMDESHVKIFEHIIKKSEIGHVTACTLGEGRGHGRCLAHNIAEGATSINHVNTFRDIIHKEFGSKGKNAWSRMTTLHRSKSGKLASNRGTPAVREHMRGGRSELGNRVAQLPVARQRELERLLNGLGL
jgi:hypothetical protein